MFSVIRLAFMLVAGVTLTLTPPSFAESPAPPSPAPIHGMPQILSVDIPIDRDFHAGQTVRGSVTTSPNVGYVEARIEYRNTPLHHDGEGKFSLVYTIPWWLPPWLRHQWTVQIIARSVDGVEVKQAFPVRVH